MGVSRRDFASHLVTAIVSVCMMSTLGLVYTHHVQAQAQDRSEQVLRQLQHESDQRWCETFSVLLRPFNPVNPRAGGLPPDSVLRATLAKQDEFARCPEKRKP